MAEDSDGDDVFACVLSWPRPHAFLFIWHTVRLQLRRAESMCVCVCVCCSHLPAPLPLIRADYTPQLVSQQLITPRQDQSSHLLKISHTWQQRRLPTYKVSSSLLACREILEKVTLVSLSSLASDIFYICYPCLLFMLEYVFMEGGFIRLCVLRSSQGPLICLDQIKVVRDDKSCLAPALNHQLETPSFAVAWQLCQRSIVRLCGSTFSPKLWQKVQTPDSLRLGCL